MQTFITSLMTASLLSLLPHSVTAITCPSDAVPVGPTCVDRYEVSVWNIDPDNQTLIDHVRRGEVHLQQLTDAGAIRYEQIDCKSTLSSCPNMYAVSIPGVQPSVALTWFETALACRNAGKRLLRNDEWQMAAFGTDDSQDGGCVLLFDQTSSSEPNPTGSSAPAGCVSDVGTYDMVGNASEWVADWLQGSGVDSSANDFPSRPTWHPSNQTLPAEYGNDTVSGVNPHEKLKTLPSALTRGGHFEDTTVNGSTTAGPFTLRTSSPIFGSGFRCGR